MGQFEAGNSVPVKTIYLMKLNINPNFFLFAENAQNAPRVALNGAHNKPDSPHLPER